MKTPVNYYGGKTALLHEIVPMIPAHNIYVEPFAGGAAVLFAKPMSRLEVINDTYDDLINLYRCIVLHFDELNDEIQATICSRSLHKKALGILRGDEKYLVMRAWAMWYSTNMSFANKVGGGHKFSNHMNTMPPRVLNNKKRRFTDEIKRRLENVDIECKDALEVIRQRDTDGTLYFVDPPYPESDQGHYKGYTMEDFIQLLDLLEKIQGKFILTNYWYPVLQEYIDRNGWHTKAITRTIQAKRIRERGKEKTEYIISNFVPHDQQTLF